MEQKRTYSFVPKVYLGSRLYSVVKKLAFALFGQWGLVYLFTAPSQVFVRLVFKEKKEK